MAKKQNQNDLGAMVAAQNEISGLQNARLQNSQAEQAFLQQQAATNGVMMQAAQLGTQPSVGQQVGAMNPQTQAILAQYGITGTPTPGSRSTTSRTTQAGPNIKIENKTTNNHEVKVINTGGGGGNSDAGNQAKFQTWLSNSFARQQGEYEIQRRAFARRDRDLEKQSNRLMRQLESGTKSLSEKLSPENWTKPLGSQFKTTMIIFMTMLLPKLIEPLGDIANKIESTVRGIFGLKGADGQKAEEPEFVKSFKSFLGVNENNTLLSGLEEIITSGFNILIDRFELFLEDRKTALEDLSEKPGLFNVFGYLKEALPAMFGGTKALAKNSVKNIKTASAQRNLEGAGTVNYSPEDLRLDTQNASPTGDGIVASNRVQQDDYSILSDGTRRIKNQADSTSRLAASIVRTMTTSDTNGIVNVAAAMQGMTDLGVAAKTGKGVIIGTKEETKLFLSIWGVDFEEFFNHKNPEFLKEENWRQISISLLHWKEQTGLEKEQTTFTKWISSPTWGSSFRISETRDNFIRVWVEENSDKKHNINHFVEDTHTPQQEIKAKLYRLTPEGYRELESRIGGEGFKFSNNDYQSFETTSKYVNTNNIKNFQGFDYSTTYSDKYSHATRAGMLADEFQYAKEEVGEGTAFNTAIENISEWAHKAIINPLEGADEETLAEIRKKGYGVITSKFGMREHPKLKDANGNPKKLMHTGLDIRMAKGSLLYSPSEGKVTYAGPLGNYGNLVEIEHQDGTKTRYAHLDKIGVSVGTELKEGDVIATVGSTGVSTGPHLHYEVIKGGKPVDPEKERGTYAWEKTIASSLAPEDAELKQPNSSSVIVTEKLGAKLKVEDTKHGHSAILNEKSGMSSNVKLKVGDEGLVLDYSQKFINKTQNYFSEFETEFLQKNISADLFKKRNNPNHGIGNREDISKLMFLGWFTDIDSFSESATDQLKSYSQSGGQILTLPVPPSPLGLGIAYYVLFSSDGSIVKKVYTFNFKINNSENPFTGFLLYDAEGWPKEDAEKACSMIWPGSIDKNHLTNLIMAKGFNPWHYALKVGITPNAFTAIWELSKLLTGLSQMYIGTNVTKNPDGTTAHESYWTSDGAYFPVAGQEDQRLDSFLQKHDRFGGNWAHQLNLDGWAHYSTGRNYLDSVERFMQANPIAEFRTPTNFNIPSIEAMNNNFIPSLGGEFVYPESGVISDPLAAAILETYGPEIYSKWAKKVKEGGELIRNRMYHNSQNQEQPQPINVTTVGGNTDNRTSIQNNYIYQNLLQSPWGSCGE